MNCLTAPTVKDLNGGGNMFSFALILKYYGKTANSIRCGSMPTPFIPDREAAGEAGTATRCLRNGILVTEGSFFLLNRWALSHTGLFPEQAVNWDWFTDLIAGAGRPIKLLNLFAYTGGATVAAAAAGASVCHVDASKGMVARARETPPSAVSPPLRYAILLMIALSSAKESFAAETDMMP